MRSIFQESHLCCIDGFQGLQIFKYDFNGELCPPQFDNLHRSSMMGCTWIGRLDPRSKVVLDSSEHDRCMVDGIDLSSKELT